MTVQIIPTFEGIQIPRYATAGSAAVDLQAAITEPVHIGPGEFAKIPVGFRIWIRDTELAGIVIPRSGRGNQGFGLKNMTGLIDSDYQGEVFVTIWNTNTQMYDAPITVLPLERIAQMLFLPVKQIQLEQVDEFAEPTVRGEGGFGSTGVSIDG